MFEVKLKAGHPTGTYHRAGRVFQAGETLKIEKLPKTMQNDAWLDVVEVKEKKATA
jgi:hypothetical protein